MDKKTDLNKKFKEGIIELEKLSEFISRFLSNIIFYLSKFTLWVMFVTGASFVYVSILFVYWLQKKFDKKSD